MVRDRVGQLQGELKQAAETSGIRWTPPEQMHLTLRFYGNVTRSTLSELEAALRKGCREVAPFGLQAVGAGAFPNLKRPRVLWVGIGGEVGQLHSLQKAVLRETSNWGEPEERDFHPHLTLARVKDPHARGIRELAQKVEALSAVELGSWRVAELHLTQSELSNAGARYTELATVQL